VLYMNDDPAKGGIGNKSNQPSVSTSQASSGPSPTDTKPPVSTPSQVQSKPLDKKSPFSSSSLTNPSPTSSSTPSATDQVEKTSSMQTHASSNPMSAKDNLPKSPSFSPTKPNAPSKTIQSLSGQSQTSIGIPSSPTPTPPKPPDSPIMGQTPKPITSSSMNQNTTPSMPSPASNIPQVKPPEGQPTKKESSGSPFSSTSPSGIQDAQMPSSSQPPKSVAPSVSPFAKPTSFSTSPAKPGAFNKSIDSTKKASSIAGFESAQSSQSAPPPPPSPGQGSKKEETKTDTSKNVQNPPPGQDEQSPSQALTTSGGGKKSKFGLIIAILVVVTVIVYGIVAYLYFSNKNLEAGDENANAPPIAQDNQPTATPTPSFSPDQINIINGSIYNSLPTGENRLLVTKDDYTGTGITGFARVNVSPNNKRLCFESLPPSPQPALYISDVTGENVKEVEKKATSCRWMAGSNRILYVNSASGNNPVDIYMYDMSSEEMNNLTESLAEEGFVKYFKLGDVNDSGDKLVCSFDKEEISNPGTMTEGTCSVDLSTGEVTIDEEAS
jgi:hypothetical protein